MQVAETGGESRYNFTFDWLRNAPPGSYRVEVYACRNRVVIARADALLRVAEAGFPVQMAAQAKDHPFGYGVFAVLTAVIAGFAIDTIISRLRFKGRAGPKRRSQVCPTPS